MRTDGQNCGCRDCSVLLEREAKVQTPVEVKVIARLGETELICGGDPAIVATECRDGCRITVIQRLHLRIPICYEAVVTECKSETECSEDC